MVASTTLYANDLSCLRTCLGCVFPCQVLSVKQLRNINSIECLPNKCFRCSSRRRSASLADDIRNNRDRAKKYRLAVTCKHEYYASKPEEDNSTSFLNVLSKQLKAFYLFSRPHTVIGTVSNSIHHLIKR